VHFKLGRLPIVSAIAATSLSTIERGRVAMAEVSSAPPISRPFQSGARLCPTGWACPDV
jgi:hypothetical protein